MNMQLADKQAEDSIVINDHDAQLTFLGMKAQSIGWIWYMAELTGWRVLGLQDGDGALTAQCNDFVAALGR